MEVERSAYFPTFDLKTIIPSYLKQCKTKGRNKTMKAFRAWVREQIK